jgi:hypothetical protein
VDHVRPGVRRFGRTVAGRWGGKVPPTIAQSFGLRDLRMSGRQTDTRIASWAWIGLIGGLSVLLSWRFACATPFAALATLAAFNLRRHEAVGLMLFTWAANPGRRLRLAALPDRHHDDSLGRGDRVSGLGRTGRR